MLGCLQHFFIDFHFRHSSPHSQFRHLLALPNNVPPLFYAPLALGCQPGFSWVASYLRFSFPQLFVLIVTARQASSHSILRNKANLHITCLPMPSGSDFLSSRYPIIFSRLRHLQCALEARARLRLRPSPFHANICFLIFSIDQIILIPIPALSPAIAKSIPKKLVLWLGILYFFYTSFVTMNQHFYLINVKEISLILAIIQQ